MRAAIPSRWVRGLSGRERSEALAWWGRLSRADAAGWVVWEASRFDDLVCRPDRAFYEPPSVRIFRIG